MMPHVPGTAPETRRRSFARHLFTILTGLSLLLCVATAVLWVRSYWRFDSVGHVRGPVSNGSLKREMVISARGTILLTRIDSTGMGSKTKTPLIAGWDWHSYPNPAAIGTLLEVVRAQGFEMAGLGGFHHHVVSGSSMLDNRTLVLPCWLLVPLFAVLPIMWCRSELRRRRRDKAGLCPKCGYDLRATPDRCPECGTTMAATTAS